VHAGVWFRLLRSLLNELSLATTTLNHHGRTTLEQVWQATGGEQRAGLAIWRPFEQLDWATQATMLHAAATALDLAADGRISARGIFGPVLHPDPYRPAYEGNRPPPDFSPMVDTVLFDARHDCAAARQLLTLLTFGWRTLARFEEERTYLSSTGIPAEFLPGARDLGRLDLL
jgi:hypothetical protein